MYEPSRQEYRQVMQSHAVQGGFALAGGIILSVIGGLAKIPFVGLAGGIVMAVAGYRMLTSARKSSGSTTQGAVLTAVGIVTAATGLPIFSGIGSTVLGLSSFGLIAYGAWRLFTYWRSYRNHR